MALTSAAAVDLTVAGLSSSQGRHRILTDVTLRPVRSGQVTAVVGPNGAGKSTLLRCLAGLQSATGQIDLHHDQDADAVGTPKIADDVLYVPQDPPPPSSLTVFETVLLARQQRGGFRVTREVEREVAAVLQQFGLLALSQRRLTQLSGGQRQLVGIAQAVVRRPAVLLLDEPTASLDLRNQVAILERIGALATTQPAAVVVTLHDLADAARFADHLVVLDAGRVYQQGPPAEVITTELLRQVYRVNAHIDWTDDGLLMLTTIGSLS